MERELELATEIQQRFQPSAPPTVAGYEFQGISFSCYEIGGDYYDFIQREEAEWEEANLIVCGSDFVRDGIARSGGPVERCVVVPYGVDASFQVPQRAEHRGPLRVLTIGTIGLRKGSPYVLAAARALKGCAEFRMVGPIAIREEALLKLREAVHVPGPVPRSEILQHYHWADIFLLPSICEGSATVAYEALSCGLPVVTTPNTGTLVQDGLDGRVVPADDLPALVQAIADFAEDRDYLGRAAQRARGRGAEFGLDAYAKRLLNVFSTLEHAHQARRVVEPELTGERRSAILMPGLEH
jgi:glycosyltransferase involved in cell wall biosynthesis